MKRTIAISVIVAITLLVASFTPSHAEAPVSADTPTFYHLVPGTYVNGWPRFTVTYPKDWVDIHPLPTEVFRAGVIGREMWSLNIFTAPWPLEQTAEPYVGFFKRWAQDVALVYDKPSQLRDGTPAREVRVQFTPLPPDDVPTSVIALATKRGDLFVQLSIHWPGHEARDDLKAVLYSLKFQPGFDEPVKLPSDVQAFLDQFRNDVVSHDVEKVMSHYSDSYLNSGVRKAERERFWRGVIGPITSLEIVVTDFIGAGDKAYLAGSQSANWGVGEVPIRDTSIIKENNEWKWYGNQRDAVAW